MTLSPLPISTNDAESLVELMDHVLDSVVGVFEQALVELPERRYWTMATPAADCEQVVVGFNVMYVGPVGDTAATPQRCQNVPRSATLTVQILRCVPTAGPRGQAPAAEEIEAAARLQAIDTWLLLESAAPMDRWMGGVIATVTAGEPQGGFQGPTMTISLQV